VHGAWVRFVTSGDPGWAPYTTAPAATGPAETAARSTMVFAESSETRPDPLSTERRAWPADR
jgi:para-nitrobenzyl esterase